MQALSSLKHPVECRLYVGIEFSVQTTPAEIIAYCCRHSINTHIVSASLIWIIKLNWDWWRKFSFAATIEMEFQSPWAMSVFFFLFCRNLDGNNFFKLLWWRWFPCLHSINSFNNISQSIYTSVSKTVYKFFRMSIQYAGMRNDNTNQSFHWTNRMAWQRLIAHANS